MECCYGIFFILGVIFVYWLYGILFLPRLGVWDIIEAVGFQWKDIDEIRDEILVVHSNKWGPPRPYPSTEYLEQMLPALVKRGYLERREVHSKPDEKWFCKYEYRRTAKRRPVRVKVVHIFSPQLGYQGV